MDQERNYYGIQTTLITKKIKILVIKIHMIYLKHMMILEMKKAKYKLSLQN